MRDPPEGERELPSRPRAEETDNLPGLMEEIRGGSAQALQKLVDRLWPELVRFATWEGGDPDGAQDMVQEAFIYLWRRRRSWVQSGSPRVYLYRLVRHQLLDEQRRRKVRESWVARERLRPRPNPPNPEEMLAAIRVEDAFSRAVASLSPRRRETFSLVVLRGLSHREAAEVLDISEQTVANQVSAALQEIRDVLRAVSHEAP